jgi:hypothetical protein
MHCRAETRAKEVRKRRGRRSEAGEKPSCPSSEDKRAEEEEEEEEGAEEGKRRLSAEFGCGFKRVVWQKNESEITRFK